MTRSIWKGPFVDPNLIKKVNLQKEKSSKNPIKTWSRKSTIIPDFVGVSFLVHNGLKFIAITISEDMVGHKLGEFSPTRKFAGHTPADKKEAQEAASAPVKAAAAPAAGSKSEAKKWKWKINKKMKIL